MNGATVRIEDGVPYIGDRSFPWAAGVDNHNLPNDRHEWRERRFRLRFESGWTLSVVWGSGTYSSNRGYAFDGAEWREEADEVEIAAWPADSGMVEWDDGDTVRGWVSADDLLALIDDMQSWPSNPPAGFVARIPERAS